MARLIDVDELAKKAELVAEMWKKSLENPKNEREASDLSKELQLFNAVVAFAKDCPTIDPVKHGHWIFDPDLISSLLCSECDFNFHWINAKRPKFCPKCGCKMDAKLGGDYLDGEKPAKG